MGFARRIFSGNADPRRLMASAMGSMIGIGLLAFLSVERGLPLLAASFGATAVLVCSVPESPLARPKNVLLGHLISAMAGVACSTAMGSEWYAMAIAVTLSITLMSATGTTHPPGGATALICVLYSVDASFVLAPVLAGAAILTAVAWMVGKADSAARARAARGGR
ncbi:MAG: HPP family protein [Candidatus Methanoplasma sp.]|jgi:CBS-domain-containing membrane protein|nr:HPP family protein [Candidatus Methanoplasma sp.]